MDNAETTKPEQTDEEEDAALADHQLLADGSACCCCSPTAVVLRFWITSDAGRAFIASQIDGRKLGPLGTIRIQGLKGDPLRSRLIADIAMSGR
jgi:hypothetical protein